MGEPNPMVLEVLNAMRNEEASVDALLQMITLDSQDDEQVFIENAKALHKELKKADIKQIREYGLLMWLAAAAFVKQTSESPADFRDQYVEMAAFVADILQGRWEASLRNRGQS